MAILHLPGVLKSDVHVSFQYKRLLVSYRAVEENEKWEPDKVIQEVTERRCVRAIPLPERVRVSTDNRKELQSESNGFSVIVAA